MSGFPEVNGVQVVMEAPEGWVVDFENPTRQYVLEHYLIFGILDPLAFIALMQRFYVKIFLSKGLQIDDGECGSHQLGTRLTHTGFMLLAWVSLQDSHTVFPRD